jgi:kexin
VSRLHKTHACSGDCTSSFADGWRFGSLRHLGEVADGDWTLSVRDGLAGDTGSFQAWELKLYGH